MEPANGVGDHQAPKEAPGVPRRRSARLRLALMVAGSLVLVVGAVLVLSRMFYRPTDGLTMTTGSFSGANYSLVTRYLVPAAREVYLDITMVPTGGSQDTLNAVHDGRVQVAIADGGLSLQGRTNIREVAPLFLTALHVLVKPQIYADAMATGDLRSAFVGKTISMSNPGSGTRTFALRELNRLGVGPSEITETPRTVSQLVDPNTTADQIPDVVFAASLLPSPIASRLVRDFGYRLLPLEYVDAVRLEDKRAYGVTIPAGTYGLSPDVPAQTITTLGYRLLLVANQEVPDGVVTELARAAFESDFAKAYDPPLTIKNLDLLPEYPRHPGALALLESHRPIEQQDIGTVLQFVIGALALACFLPAYFILRDAYRRFHQLGQAVSMRDYIAAVSDLEAQASALDESTSRGAFLELRRHLNSLKLEAMDAYTRNAVDDASLMPSFLAHVADLRTHLNTLLEAGRGHEERRPLLYVDPAAADLVSHTERVILSEGKDPRPGVTDPSLRSG